MNKLTKVGCSALCGSLAAISAASAGDMTVTGGADMTWLSKNGATSGNPLGIGSNFNIKGSGELDNGWTFDVTTAFTNVGAYSAANITLDLGGLGKFNFNQGNSGNGIAAYDDKMPTAWEESWGAGLSGGVITVLGSGASQNVMYTSPTLLGTTITATYAHEYGASDVADKGTKSADNETARSYDGTININPSLGTEILSGLNIFAGASTIKTVEDSGIAGDAYQGVGGVTYSLGPLSLGYQVSGDYTGYDAIQSAGTDTGKWNYYQNFAYGVAFNVNDGLSVSYGKWEAKKAGYSDTSVNIVDESLRTVVVDSIQAAYTMGGATISIAEINVDNQSYSTAATADLDATVISLGLAF